MFKTMLKNTDYIILTCVVILVAIGIIGIYSAGYSTTASSDEYIKQIIWFGIMFVIMTIIWAIDYRIFDIAGYIIYMISLVLLILVLFTSSIMGANSWFTIGGVLYQPSELMKIGYILVLAKLLTTFADKSKKSTIIRIVGTIILFALPVVLILLQPDFGTAAVFIMITLFMIFSNGLKYRYLVICLALVLVITPIIYFFVLNPVQQERILVFIDPTRDPLGSGYNAIQSKIAVGSGMLFGSGYLQGTQTQYGYLPIKTSDFIFASLSEEWGFVMSAAIVILFVILIARIIMVGYRAKDNFAKLTVMGIAGMIFFHFVQNIGMTMGLLPITGIPLPFVSYGGSSLMTNLIAIAIVLNVSARKSKNLFMD